MKVEVFGKPGTKVRLDGQEYELVRVGFYQNGSGDVREVAYWRSICAEPGCRQEFEAFEAIGSLELSRRCPEHRKPGIPVRLRGKRGRPRKTAHLEEETL
jgi:hypothetical protein